MSTYLVEGFRVLELMVDEGDRVKKGDVLATLVQESLDAQLAQNEASLARAEATISQKKSPIAEMTAKVTEAAANFERAKPLKNSGYVSGITYDQREAAAAFRRFLLEEAQQAALAAHGLRRADGTPPAQPDIGSAPDVRELPLDSAGIATARAAWQRVGGDE